MEKLRAGVSPALAAVVRKMMAKRPADRYQTAAEAATALKDVLDNIPSAFWAGVVEEGELARLDPASPGAAETQLVQAGVPPATTVVEGIVPAAPPKPPRRLLPVYAAGGLLLAVIVAMVIALAKPSGSGSNPRKTDEPGEPTQVVKKPSSLLDNLKWADIPEYERKIAERGSGSAMQQMSKYLVAVWGNSRLKHWAAVYAVAFSPDGKLLASAGADFTIKLWDPSTGEELRTLTGHTGTVHTLAFRPDGKELASGSADGTIRFWDPATGKQGRPAPKALKGVPIHSLVYNREGNRLAVASGDKRVRILPVGVIVPTVVIEGPHLSAAFSPDGKTVVTGGYDRKVQWWDTAKGKELTIRASGEHRDIIDSVAFSPDGRMVASAGRDHLAILWDAATGKELHRLQSPHWVYSVRFTRDSKVLVAAAWNGAVSKWNCESGERLAVLDLEVYLHTMALGPDDTTLAAGGPAGMVHLWDVNAKKPILTPSGPQGSIRSLVFDRELQTLITGGIDATLCVWDPRTGKERTILPKGMRPYTPMVLSRDGKTLAIATAETALLWDLSAEKPAIRFQTQKGRVHSVALYGDAPLLATGDFDGTIKLWDPSAQEELGSLKGHESHVTCLAVSEDSKLLASGCSDGIVGLWDLMTGKQLRLAKVHTSPVSSVRFHPKGQAVISSGGDGLVKAWPLPGAKNPFTLVEHARRVFSADFSRDGNLVASAGQDGVVRVNRYPTANPQSAVNLRLAPEGASISQVAFAPDGRHLFTANGNGTVYVFRLGK